MNGYIGGSGRKPSGLVFVTGPDGEIQEGETLSCVHCQHTWVKQTGSGKVRGWCEKCCGPICGPSCLECIPAELRWDNLESGKPELTPAVVKILVPAGVEGLS